LNLFIEILLLIFATMANRLKPARSPSPDPDTLKPEKEEQVSVKELVRDERTHKIAGAVLLLCCLFLFTCFSSYLFTWSEDQSVVRGVSIFFPDKDIKIANVLGTFGAWVSHEFFFNGFGLASYLFCILFFVIGINSITGKPVFSFWRHLLFQRIARIYIQRKWFSMGRRSRQYVLFLAHWCDRMAGNRSCFGSGRTSIYNLEIQSCF
jgi:hypothetical protein